MKQDLLKELKERKYIFGSKQTMKLLKKAR